MPRARKTTPSREELLREYEFCQRTATSMEATIWQTAAAMSLGLVGAFLLVATREVASQPPWWAAALMGALSFGVSTIWWVVARRWWSVQHAMFYRMRHIERTLGLHSLRYVQYLDHPALLKTSTLAKSQIDELAARAAKANTVGIKDHQKLGPQSVLWLLPFLLAGIWGLYSLILLMVQLLEAA